jgi:hypothetical protein
MALLLLKILALVLGFIGSVLLYYYGVPHKLFIGVVFIDFDKNEKENLEEKRRYEYISKLGIMLIGWSFGIPLVYELLNIIF